MISLRSLATDWEDLILPESVLVNLHNQAEIVRHRSSMFGFTLGQADAEEIAKYQLRLIAEVRKLREQKR